MRNRNESKTRFRLYGKDRVQKALNVSRAEHITMQLEQVLKQKSMTQAEIFLCDSIIGE